MNKHAFADAGTSALHRHEERDLRAVPVDADRPFGGAVAHVGTSMVANMLTLVIILVVSYAFAMAAYRRKIS